MVAGRLAMNQLIQLKKMDGSVLRVIDWITSLNDYECEDFAHMLLKNDSRVERHLTECGGDNNKFIRAVLRDWLSRDDDDDDDDDDAAVPRTWGDLATCVEDSGLPGALVKAIREFLSLGISMTDQHVLQLHNFIAHNTYMHSHMSYRNLGNFCVRKFRAKNFCEKIFSWSTMAHENILTTKKLHAQNFSLD